MAFEDTIEDLLGEGTDRGINTELEEGEEGGSGCFSSTPPLNPINQIILSVFGENYFPPYNTQFQPEKKDKLTNEKLLQMQVPGGGKIRPIATPVHTTIADYVTPISAMLGAVFNFFGPIFIILDVIRGLIDIICSFFNPIPAIASIIELFVTIIPPLIALYPPFSSILHALNTVKLVMSIVAALLSHVVPIIEKVVTNALSITDLLLAGNIKAVESVTAKICTLITYLENQIGALSPISIIIELLTSFINLGAKFFCIKGFDESPCCTAESCPPVIVNPPAGRAVVIRKQDRFSLLDLMRFVFDFVKPGIDIVEGILNIIVDNLFATVETTVNTFLTTFEDTIEEVVGVVDDAIEVVTGYINDGLDFLVDIIIDFLEIINTPLVGALNGLLEDNDGDGTPDAFADVANFDVPTVSLEELGITEFELDLPDVDIDLPDSVEELVEFLGLGIIGLTPQIIDSIVFIQPEMEIKMQLTGGNQVVSSENEFGLLSEVGVGYAYSLEELKDLQNFIVEPNKIPASQDDTDPASIRIRMTREADNAEALGGVVPPPKNLAGEFLVSDNPLSLLPFFGVSEFPADTLIVRDDSFNAGDVLSFQIEPDQVALLSLNLIGFGCQNDVAAAAQGLGQFINADVDVGTGFDPLRDKVGLDFPQPPIAELNECIARQAANPEISQEECFTETIGTYIEDLTEFYDAVLCSGVSRVRSPFEVSKNFVLADSEDSAVITLGVRDLGGNDLLQGAIPTSSFRAEFYTTKGTLGPVIFDEDASEFRATLSSDEEGSAEITGAFIVNDEVCMRPGEFDGFIVTDKILAVEFLPEQGQFPRRRRQRQYVQARGGRRR